MFQRWQLGEAAGWAAATFSARWVLGLIFVMAGGWKVFDRGLYSVTTGVFVKPYAETWIPEWLLWALGYGTSLFELMAGILLCLGLMARLAACGIGLLLVVTTYGHLLLEPLFDIDGFTFTRLALALFVMVAPSGRDLFSLDYLLTRNAARSGD